jgi:predicted RND superfamily exporter protein
MDSQTALVQTLQYLGPAIFWVLLTTAGGFASLLVCQIKPVYDFGTIMTLATVLIGAAVAVFFPLTAIGWGNRPIQHGRLEPITQYWLVRLLIAIDRYPKLCGAVILLPGLVLALGILRLQPQTDFTNNFRPETEVYRAYRFIEDHYGGVGQLELILDTPDLLALSNQELKDYVDRLRRLEDKLTEIRIETEQGEKVYGLSKAVSIPEFYSFFDEIPLLGQMLTPRARLRLLAGDIDAARQELVPVARALLGKFSRYVEANAVLPAFWNRDERKLRIVLQARERLSTWAKRDLLRQIERCCREELGNAAEFRITGIYLMLAGLIESVLRDQAYTTVVALGCMFGMALLAFRSLKLAAIAMVPTVLPVLAVVGTMGWIGLPVNIATAMLASVAMGMTIDSSILYLYRLREEQAAGRSFAEALVRTHGSTGAALMVASVALVLGFSVLTQSRFLPLVHFGLLAALALLGGVIGNLVLLPLLLRWTHRRDWREVGAVALRRASTGLWLSSDNQPAALSASDVSAPTTND